MLDHSDSVDQVVYLVVVLVAMTVIGIKVIRTFRQSGKRSWPTLFVGIYNILLLLLFLVGMMTEASWEGFGFLPLWALTLPWSGIAVWFSSHSGLADHNFAGSGFNPTYLINFIFFNLLAGPANSCILYLFLKRRQRRVAEDEAWEQARRNR